MKEDILDLSRHVPVAILQCVIDLLTSVTEEPIICQSRRGFPICVSLKFINWRVDLFSDFFLVF
jgi:hypothetical protein